MVGVGAGLLLLLDFVSFLAFCLYPTLVVGFGLAALFNKDRPIVEVLQPRQTSDQSLPVAPDSFSFADLVVLEVQDLKAGHFDKNFVQDLAIRKTVRLQIDHLERRTLQKPYHVLKSVVANLVVLQIKRLQTGAELEAFNLANGIVGQL